MTLTAGDIAQTRVATLAPEAPLLNAQRLFIEEQISGAPVVDDSGRVVGVVSSADLLRAVVDEHDSGRSQAVYFRDLLEFSGPDWERLPEDFQDRLEEVVVGDVMTDSLVSVPATAPVAEVARVMRDGAVHRVLVLKEGFLVGLISSLDLVGLVADGRLSE